MPRGGSDTCAESEDSARLEEPLWDALMNRLMMDVCLWSADARHAWYGGCLVARACGCRAPRGAAVAGGAGAGLLCCGEFYVVVDCA